MLAPDDVSQTEQSLGGTIQATTAVTIYAAAMRFQVSPLLELPLPAWFGSIKTSLQTAIGHARAWQDNLCGQIAISVPQGFIDYDAVFQPISNQLINLITTIEMSGGATRTEHQQAGSLLGTLLSHLDAQSTSLAALHGQVVQLMDDVQADHSALLDAAATIAQNVPDGGVISKQIQSELGDDFLDTTVTSPCSVSLLVKESIDLRITQTAGANGELLPYVIALAVLAKAQADNEVATRALSSVLTEWQLLRDLLQDVVTDLQNADDDGVLPILEKLDVQMAQGVWTQLKAFCVQLTNGAGIS